MRLMEAIKARLEAAFCGLLVRPAVLDRLNAALLKRAVIFGDPARVHIDGSALVHNALINVSSGSVHIAEEVFFGHNVSLLTGTHDYSKVGRGRQTDFPTAGRDIRIERGAWLATNVTVVGPAVIGEHSVIGAGAVVLGDVPPWTLVAGVPARPIRRIEDQPPV